MYIRPALNKPNFQYSDNLLVDAQGIYILLKHVHVYCIMVLMKCGTFAAV